MICGTSQGIPFYALFQAILVLPGSLSPQEAEKVCVLPGGPKLYQTCYRAANPSYQYLSRAWCSLYNWLGNYMTSSHLNNPLGFVSIYLQEFHLPQRRRQGFPALFVCCGRITIKWMVEETPCYTRPQGIKQNRLCSCLCLVRMDGQCVYM